MKNKKSSVSATFRLALHIFICYVIATAITFSIVSILIVCNVNVGAWGLPVLALLILVSCTIIAFIMTYIRMNDTTKAMNEIKLFLVKMSSGDFSCELKIKVKDHMLKEMVDNLNILVGELNSVAVLKNDFVRNFSHEFKTPIVSIKGFSELLCKDKTLTVEEKEKYYTIIQEESERLANLANMTLMLSKLDNQNIPIDKENFYIDEQIKECALQLAAEVEKKNIEVDIDIEHITCYATKELSKEIWLNLFSNAVKYTNENGHIKIFSYETSQGIAICFQDDGIGISDETKKHIFDEYYQADSKTHKGIGLGLSIVKRIVEIHGWMISVTSTIGQGSVFTITIRK